MFMSHYHILGAERQPTQRRFKPAQPCQGPGHEDYIVSAADLEPSLSDVAAGFPWWQEDGICIERTSLDYPASNRISRIMFKDHQTSAVYQAPRQFLYGVRTLIRRYMMHNIGDYYELVVGGQISRSRCKATLSGEIRIDSSDTICRNIEAIQLNRGKGPLHISSLLSG